MSASAMVRLKEHPEFEGLILMTFLEIIDDEFS